MLQATRDAITNFLGNRTDDEAIALLEVIDNEGIDEENWKEKYEMCDAEWRKKYTERFKSNPAPVPVPQPAPEEVTPEERNESLKLDNLLYKKDGE